MIRHVGLVLALAFGLILGGDQSVQAVDTQVEVQLCQPSTINILTPVDKSTVHKMPVTVKGTVAYSNQIEIYVDDQLGGIIPLASGQSEFAKELEFATGTHNIRLKAVGVCDVPDGTDSIFVTYDPTGPDDFTGGTGVSAVQEIEDDSPLFDWGIITRPLSGFMRWLNIDYGTQTHGLNLIPLWRVIAVTAGFYLLVFGLRGRVLAWVVSWRAFKNVLSTIESARRLRVFGVAVRLFGLLVVALALLL